MAQVVVVSGLLPAAVMRLKVVELLLRSDASDKRRGGVQPVRLCPGTKVPARGSWL